MKSRISLSSVDEITQCSFAHFLYLMCRVWRPKRVVITERMIAFAHVNDDALVDKIPIHEIVGIEGFVDQRVGTEKLRAERIPVLKSENVLTSHKNINIQREGLPDALRISTLPNGHNGGREYCLRAASSTLCEELVSKLTEYSESAKLAVSNSRVANMHQKLKMVYDSGKFQALAAVLIILVMLLQVFPDGNSSN